MRVADIVIFRYARYGLHSRCISCRLYSRYLICSLHAFSPYAFPFFRHFSVCELQSIFMHFLYASCRLYHFSVYDFSAMFILGMSVIRELQCSFSGCELQCSFSVCELQCSFSVCELQFHSRYVSCSVHSRYLSCNFILGM